MTKQPKRYILANRLRTPKGHIIESVHRHDYVTYEEDGVQYMVDGGTDYLRRSLVGEDCSIYSDDPFDVIREGVTWGTYGKNGDEPLRRVPLSQMSDAHIQAVLDTQDHMAPYLRALMIVEQKYRKEHDITITD